MWSHERIAEVAAEMTARIGAWGTRVVGDLGGLAPPIVEHAADDWPDVASELVRTSRGLHEGRAEALRVRGTAGERAGARGRYGKGRLPESKGQRKMEATPSSEPLLLPEGTLLVHIGPPKTGTTALQGAFHAARSAAGAQGVHYAGRHRHSVSAVQAVIGKNGFYTGDTPPPISGWRNLAREARRSDAKRVVLSSEFFADAPPEAIRTIVNDLGGARVHVVVTLRPLARIIPSQWQQYIQSNWKVSFDDWLDAMFNKAPGKVTPSFWYRHRHDQLIARWAEVVGYDHMTVVALDETDHDFVLRAFEGLTGLSEGTLEAVPDAANRSLTLPETEAVRAFNVAFRNEGLSRPLHSRVMNFGAARYMKEATPPEDALRVEAPQWALDRAGVVAREMVDAITATGVRVVGDLESLAQVPTSHLDGDHQPVVTVPPSVAATMAMGVLYSSGLARERGARGDDPKAWNKAAAVPIRGEPIELVRVPTRDLFGVLVRRGTASVRRRLPGGRAGAG